MPGLFERAKIEGIEIGIEKGKIEVMLLVLSSRIGPVPQPLVERIQALDLTNPAHLNELVLLSAKCESLEEFEKAL